MDYKKLCLGLFAILASYLIVNMPIAFATNVNIYFNDELKETVQISTENLINSQINMIHEPSDVTWNNIKILVKISSASMAKSISKIYLYKCRKMDPVDCIKEKPLEFETYIDTELAWNDISDKVGRTAYPQEGNLLVLVKLEGTRTSWVGKWNKILRTNYNVFDIKTYDLDNIDFYVNSADLVEPAKTFIDNYQMIPFNWATKVIFKTAGIMYAIGASEAEIESGPPRFVSVQTKDNMVDQISKDYYFVLPNTSKGISNPFTLNLNPSFSCGNNKCETGLGETMNNCCYDCGCPEGEYCDVSDTNKPETGTCKEMFSLGAVIPVISKVENCLEQQTGDIVIDIIDPPSGLRDTVPGLITLNQTKQSSSCSLLSNKYSCPIIFKPIYECGVGSYDIGPNKLKITITYNDGPNVVTEDFEKDFNDITVSYECACAEGYYCDVNENICRSESAISLFIAEVTSYIEYDPAANNFINITARINNPPSDLNVESFMFELGNLTYDDYSKIIGSGTADCSGGTETDHVYTCKIPFSIQDYNHEKQYVIRDNKLEFSVSYANPPSDRITKILTSQFSDITIPSYRCGDDTCNPEEDDDSCCIDCGCEDFGENFYCDYEVSLLPTGKCKDVTKIGLGEITLEKDSFKDCDVQHTINLRTQINDKENRPISANPSYYYYILNDEIQGWPFACANPGSNGFFNCTLTLLAPKDECVNAYPDDYVIGTNRLNYTIIFANGFSSLTKELSRTFDDIKIKATPHCGDGVCENEIGEDASNCCIDCVNTDYSCQAMGLGDYCDYDPVLIPNGLCKFLSDTKLEIISPKQIVRFDSCEISNELKVKATVVDPPSGMHPENYNAIINNTNAELINCRLGTEMSTGNMTIDCNIIIPSLTECESNKEYVYTNNLLTLYVSYKDGKDFINVMDISASFSDIVILQKVRTLYEITEQMSKDMESQIQNMMDIIKQLKDRIKDCLKITKTVGEFLIAMQIMAPIAHIVGGGDATGGTLGAVIGTTAALAGAPIGIWGIAGATLGGILGASKKESGENLGSTMLALGQISNAIFGVLSKMCDILVKYEQMAMEMIQVDIQMIQVQYCMNLVQHEMDIGRCHNREMSCFNMMMNCMNFASIRNSMESVSNYVGSIGEDIRGIGQYTQDMSEATGWFDGQRFTVQFQCDGNSHACCGLKQSITQSTFTQWGIITPSYIQPNKFKVTTIGLSNTCRSPYKPYLEVDGVLKTDKKLSGTSTDFGNAIDFFGQYPQKDFNIKIVCIDEKTGNKREVSGSSFTLTYCMGDTNAKRGEDPCKGTPCESKVDTSAASKSKCDIREGIDVEVDKDSYLLLAEAKAGSTEICRMPKGTIAYVIEGKDGLWWKLKIKETTEDKCKDKTGWTTERAGMTCFLKPKTQVTQTTLIKSSIISPLDDATVKGTVTISGKASDPDKFEELEKVYLGIFDERGSTVKINTDGSALHWSTKSTTSSKLLEISDTNDWSVNWDTTKLNDKKYDIEIKATYEDGNTDTHKITVTVDNDQPRPTGPCKLTEATITPDCDGGSNSDCEQGETITLTGKTTGDCSSVKFFQIDAKSSDNKCNIEYSGGTMKGIYDNNPVIHTNTITGSWSIPSVPEACKEKTITAYETCLYSSTYPKGGDEISCPSAEAAKGSVKFSTASTQSNLPDLQVTEISFVPDPPVINQETQITWKVENKGGQNVPSSFDVVVYDDDTDLMCAEIISETVAKTTNTYTGNCKVTLLTPSHTIKVVADANNKVTESNENNNEKIVTKTWVSESQQEKVKMKQDLSLRDAASSTSSNSLGTIKTGIVGLVLERINSYWTKVKFCETEGFVNAVPDGNFMETTTDSVTTSNCFVN